MAVAIILDQLVRSVPSPAELEEGLGCPTGRAIHILIRREKKQALHDSGGTVPRMRGD